MSDRDDLAPVKIRPGYSFGRPTVRGLRCENVAERVMAGEAVEAIADDFGLTEAEVLLACWYVATYERRRRAWRPWWRWAREAYHALADGARPVDPFEDERP